MGKKHKLLEKLKRMPKDFTFEEARTLLESFGYTMRAGGKTGGSRVKFYLGKKVFCNAQAPSKKRIAGVSN